MDPNPELRKDNTAELMALSHEELVRKHQGLQVEFSRQTTALRKKVEAANNARDQAVEHRDKAQREAKDLRLQLEGAKAREVNARKRLELEAEVERLTNRLMTMQGALGASQALRMHAMQVISVFVWLEDKTDLTDEEYDRKMEVLLRRARRVRSVWLQREAREKQILVPLDELDDGQDVVINVGKEPEAAA